MAAARVRQVKTLEKVMLGIRACSVEKLQQLNSEFVDHQDWLRQTLADTKDHKDALGLVCPRTTRKATKAKSVVAKAMLAEGESKEDQENIENGATAKPARKGRGKASRAPLAEAAPGDDLSVFDPEELSEAEAEAEAQPAKPKARKGGRQARHKEKSEQAEERPAKEAAPEPAEAVEEKEEKKAPVVTCHKADLQKLKVVELRAELQQRGLPMAGPKADLVDRLNAAMVAESFRADSSRKKLLVGREVRPVLGMRVVHVLGEEHGSSRGLFGTVEYIPGRGGNPNERSVSVRWMADLSDVRGPYYTGESCDRGSGVGDAKYDLHCIDDVDQDLFPEGPADGILGLQVEEREGEQAAYEEEEEEGKAQEQEEAMEEEEEAPRVSIEGAGAEEEADEESTPIEATPARGNGSSSSSAKRPSASPPAEEPAEKKRKPSPPAASPEHAAPVIAASEAVPAATALMEKLGAVRSAWAEREAAAPGPAPVPKLQEKAAPQETPPTAPTAQAVIMAQQPAALRATPTDTTTPQAGSVNASVESFRAILNRIHSGHTPTVEQPASTPASSSASASEWASRVSAPRVLSTHKPAEAQASEPASGGAFSRAASGASGSNKSGTWPVAQAPQAYKAAADPFARAERDSRGSGGYSALTSEALSAHVQSQGKVDPVQMLGVGKGQGGAVPKVLDVRVSQSASNAAQQQRVLDAASRQQRAAENRARMEEDKKKQMMEQERRRREAEAKRIEAERQASERRQREIQAQQDKAEAARVRALQDEERRARAAQEQEQLRAQKEREVEKERLRAAAAAQVPKPAVPVFAPGASPALSGGQPNSASKGIFGAIGGFVKGVGSVFGGQEPAQQQAQAQGGVKKEEIRHPPESGPTSIQIQMEKNSDESDEDEDEERKQQPPSWARSPNLRMQIERQATMSPTPIFGECKKTCDLGHIFQNHQPKRRKYDKRTSSADWGDVDQGRASYMEEERFQRQMIQNMAMQHAGKSKY